MRFALSLLGNPDRHGCIRHAGARRWCRGAFYNGRFGGASNCGFHTYEQCLATISGIGGWCQPNTTYVPPPPGRHRHNRPYPY